MRQSFARSSHTACLVNGVNTDAQTHKHTIAPLPSASNSFAPFIELQESVVSQFSAISPFVDQLMRFVKLFVYKLHDVDGSEVDIEIALREALANAVIHDNHENPDKKAYVTCRCSMDGEVSIMIRDEGQGFDSRALLDPVGPGNPSLTHGWGICFMQALMDEVRFEENGKVVLMRKAVGKPVRRPRISL
jgi:serine/threonine-protein kinase RsbW